MGSRMQTEESGVPTVRMTSKTEKWFSLTAYLALLYALTSLNPPSPHSEKEGLEHAHFIDRGTN